MARNNGRAIGNGVTSFVSATKRAARSAVPAAPAALPLKDETMDSTTHSTANTTADMTADMTGAATDQAKTMFADATERAKGTMAKGQMMFGEMGEFGKGNVEAMVEASKIAARGMEQVGQSAAAYMRSSLEEAQAQARTLASAGSPTEFLKLQGDFARTAFDRMVAEASRNTEAMLKLAGEVAQPISNRVALAADRMKVAA